MNKIILGPLESKKWEEECKNRYLIDVKWFDSVYCKSISLVSGYRRYIILDENDNSVLEVIELHEHELYHHEDITPKYRYYIVNKEKYDIIKKHIKELQ